MSIATYSELKDAVAEWLGRSDLTGRLPDFITNAEASLNRALHHPGMEVRATTTVDTTSTEPQYISLPDDFQTMRRVRLNSVVRLPTLDFLSEVQINAFRSGNNHTNGQPTGYTIFGDEMELFPTPDSDYTLEMVYRGKLPALETNSTNWLLDLAPDVYLYGSLMQAAPYARDAESAALWTGLYQNAYAELERHGRSLKYGSPILGITIAGVTP